MNYGYKLVSPLRALETKLQGRITRRLGMKEPPTKDEQKLDSFVKTSIQRNPLLRIGKYSSMLQTPKEDRRLDQQS